MLESQCSSVVEQRFRKPSVAGSNPAIGSSFVSDLPTAGGQPQTRPTAAKGNRRTRSFQATPARTETPAKQMARRDNCLGHALEVL